MTTTHPKGRPDGSGALFRITTPAGVVAWRAERTVWEGSHRRRVSGTGTSQRAALARLEANLERRRLGSTDAATDAAAVTRPPTPTFEAWTHTWLEGRRTSLAPASLVRYRSSLAHVLPTLGSTPLDEITAECLTGLFHDRLVGGPHSCGGAARRAAWVVTSAAMTAAVKRGIIDVSPMTRCEPVKAPTSGVALDDQRRIGTRCAIVKIWIAHLQEVGDDPSWTAGIMLLTLGLRLSEALGLTWEQITLTADAGGGPRAIIDRQLAWAPIDGQPQWTLRAPKERASTRVVPLPPAVVAALTSLKAHDQRLSVPTDQRRGPGAPAVTALVWRAPRGGVWQQRAWEKTWTRRLNTELRRQGETPLEAGKTLDGQHICPSYFRAHYLRHVAASMLEQAGVTEAARMQILGHASAAVSRAYVSTPMADLVAGAAAIATALMTP